MFLEFYGLKQEPFGVTPDPRFLFPTAAHREALAAIRYGIEAGRGFLALIAPPGMGKTTLLFRLLKHLQGNARTVFLFQTVSSPTDLMRYLLMDLGIEHLRDMVGMHRELNQILLNESNAGRRFVLVIDEAQSLSEPVLEAARMLSNFETPTSKLMQIVLSGQPELGRTLKRPSLSQLRQRISIFTRLEPFKPEETFAYIEHRLNVAGREGPPLFTRAALELIAEHSQGIPRTINNLCANALSLGFAVEQATIGPAVISRVIADLCVPLPDSHEDPKVPAAGLGATSRNLVSSVPPTEPNAQETRSGWQDRIFAPPPPKMPLPPPDPRPRPATEANPVPEIAFDEELQLAVMQLSPSASLAPPAPKSVPAPKSRTPEIPFGERIRWPSSLSMIGEAPVSPRAPQRVAPAPEPRPAEQSAPKPQASLPTSNTVASESAVTPEPALPAMPLAEPGVTEIRLGQWFTLRIGLPAPKSPARARLAKPLNYGVPPAESGAPALKSAEQRLFSKASWALISLAFVLTLYISTKLWFNGPDGGTLPDVTPAEVIPSAGAADVPQAEPSEPMEPIPHIVRQNETLEGIARSYFGYWDAAVRAEILKLNPNLNPKQLRVGQQILIPQKIPQAPAAAIPQTPDAAAQGQVRPYE